MKKRHFKYDDLQKLLIVTGLLMVLIYFSFYLVRHADTIISFWHSKMNLTEIVEHFRTRSFLNFAILLILTALTAAIPFVSNAVFAIFNGVIYGPLIGFLMNLVANIIGNFLFVKLSSFIKISGHEKKIRGWLDDLEGIKNQDLAIISAYAIPLIPKLIVNLTLADMKIPAKKCFYYISLGVLPTSLFYALGGDALGDGNGSRLLILLLIFIILYLISLLIKRKKVN